MKRLYARTHPLRERRAIARLPLLLVYHDPSYCVVASTDSSALRTYH